MRKILLFLAVIGILISVSACSIDEAHDNTVEISPSSTGTYSIDSAESIEPAESLPDESDGFFAFGQNIEFNLSEKGEFYELYQHVDGTAIYYRIWDTNGNTLDFAYYEKAGQFSQIVDLLELSMTCGTFCRWVKYYDVNGSRISRFFNNPLAINEELVVYTSIINDAHCLVVQNIFDQTEYYKVIEMDPKPNSAVQFDATFIDTLHIQVTYSTADGEFSQVYDLST